MSAACLPGKQQISRGPSEPAAVPTTEPPLLAPKERTEPCIFCPNKRLCLLNLLESTAMWPQGSAHRPEILGWCYRRAEASLQSCTTGWVGAGTEPDGPEYLAPSHLKPWAAAGSAWQRSHLQIGHKCREFGLRCCSLAVLASEQWLSSSWGKKLFT